MASCMSLWPGARCTVKVLVISWALVMAVAAQEPSIAVDEAGTLHINAVGDVVLNSTGKVVLNGIHVEAALAYLYDAPPNLWWSAPEQRVISTTAVGGFSVYAADLDADGDLDVLSASCYDNKIAWYRNNGDGTFSAQIIISNATDGAISVYAADLDGDCDLDVLSASENDNKIAWYQNNGNGTFSAQIVISTAAEHAISVYAADLDDDGDLDVLSASVGDDKIAWYRNNGNSTFSAQIIISTSADGARSVHAADLDGDGDLDVLSASRDDNKIACEELGEWNSWLCVLGDAATLEPRALEDVSDFAQLCEASWSERSDAREQELNISSPVNPEQCGTERMADKEATERMTDKEATCRGEGAYRLYSPLPETLRCYQAVEADPYVYMRRKPRYRWHPRLCRCSRDEYLSLRKELRVLPDGRRLAKDLMSLRRRHMTRGQQRRHRERAAAAADVG
ncbi:uncharacterized protein MONBRDRAFT_5660 [Monosiga brevicollis MX1]|uniref:VCBS repeat-containing protein n=1 Tax=Monosiga brevicollis TaxID=81824 RepID=A9US31_MONBE|nr:uncharacterized protein MONBRDRAFT_5660 [Monosiga brevicollis MX1]EDQ92032.1 predicted protein [Monosiga brevicollis MX1]|eukprot:XP_001743318.1 hypothetical protein [Monosiga brevicollis MX1]